MRIWVTGAAGFIGHHLARRLLAEGHAVVGIDGMTAYYDPRLKAARLADLEAAGGDFAFHRLMLEDMAGLQRLAAEAAPDVVVHLAAQAGVRYSLEHPRAYVDSNLTGAFNVLEIARLSGVRHLLFASTSSVYGANPKVPFAETDAADHPMTLYAATKKSGELMSHAYAHLWGLPTTCFRFFTVYGPWGRPDMALYRFVESIEAGRPIEVYNRGEMRRDFTYVADLVEAVARLIPRPPEQGRPAEGAADTLSPVAPWRVVNIGFGQPVRLTEFIDEIERALGRSAQRTLLPMQPGDVPQTFADSTLLFALTGYRPSTPVRSGVQAFVDWYRAYMSR